MIPQANVTVLFCNALEKPNLYLQVKYITI